MDAFLKPSKSSGAVKSSATPATSTDAPKKRSITPWVEKYRPKTVEDVVEQVEVVRVLQQCVDGADLPNMLLYGPPGTGKTSTILAAARQLFGDLYKERILELNASDERGINVVRTKIKNFAQLTASSQRPDGKKCPPFKIIILDEADSMTNAAQAALRRTMEKESRSTRFCLICNYVSRIIEPITSRCSKFRFKALGDEKIVERLQTICEAEQLKVEGDVYKTIVDISGGDLRRAITLLQSCYTLKKCDEEGPVIKVEDLDEISGLVPLRFLDQFYDICKNQRSYSNLEDFAELMNQNGYSVIQMFDQLTLFIVNHPHLTNREKSFLCERLGESCMNLQEGGSEYLQLMDFGCSAILTLGAT